MKKIDKITIEKIMTAGCVVFSIALIFFLLFFDHMISELNDQIKQRDKIIERLNAVIEGQDALIQKELHYHINQFKNNENDLLPAPEPY